MRDMLIKTRDKADHTTEGFKEWLNHHKTSGNCQYSNEGSSPGMGTFAAQKMWERSIKKTQHAISMDDMRTKEEDFIVKLDCNIGHVGKRMFKALDELRKSTKGKLADGKFVGGQKGRLTSGQREPFRTISELYRNAIRQNNDPYALGDDEKIQATVQEDAGCHYGYSLS